MKPTGPRYSNQRTFSLRIFEASQPFARFHVQIKGQVMVHGQPWRVPGVPRLHKEIWASPASSVGLFFTFLEALGDSWETTIFPGGHFAVYLPVF